MATEKRLIDANALAKVINGFDMRYFTKMLLRQEIAQMPTVDAVEVVHGRWEEWWCDNYLQYFHKCSACGVDALTKEGTMYDEVLSNYCPNCGAKMDGGKDDGKID